MKIIKILVITIFIVIFCLLLWCLISIYRENKEAKAYSEFVTNSTNQIITSVENVNSELNKIQYDGIQEEYTVDLEKRATSLQSEIDRIKNEQKDYAVPKSGHTVEAKFNEYIGQSEIINNSLADTIQVVKNLDSVDTFETKINLYIEASNKLQSLSKELETELSLLVQTYQKIDFKRFTDEIKSI